MSSTFRQSLTTASSVFSRRTAATPQALRLRPSNQLQARAQLQNRTFTSSSPRSARYERFGSGQTSPPPGGGRPDILSFLRRRAGGDRALVIYGVAIGGGGIYYVAQYVLMVPSIADPGRIGISQLTGSLERVEETGRLRFMDVSHAQEREVRFSWPTRILFPYRAFAHTKSIARATNTTPDPIRIFHTRLIAQQLCEPMRPESRAAHDRSKRPWTRQKR